MFLNEHLLLHIKTFSCESSHKYTLTSSGQRQSSDGGVMRNTYEKNMKLYLYKNEIYEIKLLKIEK